jgi:hypothetical protein
MLYNPRLPAPAATVARKADVRIAAWLIGFFGETFDSFMQSVRCGSVSSMLREGM